MGIFLRYARYVLHVKATTNNVITTGDCGWFQIMCRFIADIVVVRNDKMNMYNQSK